MLNEIEAFLGENNSLVRDKNKDWEDLIFILCSECGWTQKEVEETDIPFINDFMIGRNRHIKKENDAIKKANKRH